MARLLQARGEARRVVAAHKVEQREAAEELRVAPHVVRQLEVVGICFIYLFLREKKQAISQARGRKDRAACRGPCFAPEIVVVFFFF